MKNLRTRKNKRRFNIKTHGGLFSSKKVQPPAPTYVSNNPVTYKELADGVYKNILFPVIFSDLGTNVMTLDAIIKISGNIMPIVNKITEIISVILPSEGIPEQDYLRAVVTLFKNTYGQDILKRLNIIEPGQIGGGWGWGSAEPAPTGPLTMKEILDKFNIKWNELINIGNNFANVYTSATTLPQTISTVNVFLIIRKYIGNPTDYATLENIIKYFLTDNFVARMGLIQ